MTTETINGLLLQKAVSKRPIGGDERWFSWEEKQGKSGKPYIKIKNESQEYGGELCKVISAEKTDFMDTHGNVSYNVEFVPKNSGNPYGGITPDVRDDKDFIPMTHDTKGGPLSGVDEAKACAMQSANGMLIALEAARYTVLEWEKRYEAKVSEDQFQAITSTFFIRLDKQGLISKLPTKLK